MRRLSTITLALFTAAFVHAQPNSVTLIDAGGTILSTHASIQTAYDAIPAPLTAPLTIEISAVYTGVEEARPLTFYAKAGAAETARISIRPAAGNPEVPFYAAADTSPAVLFDGGSFITFDGASASAPDGRAFRFAMGSGGGPTQHPSILFIGGATGNTLRACRVEHGVIDGIGVRIADPTAFPMIGNRIEGCEFISGRLGVGAGAGVAGLTISTSRFTGAGEAAIHISPGASGIMLDSNRIDVEVYSRMPVWGIRAATADDTLRITRNSIFFSAYARDSATTGIEIEGGSAAGPFTYALLANNFIANAAVPLFTPPTGSFFGVDSFQKLTAVAVVGSGAGTAGIFYNTILLRGEQTYPTAAGAEGSAALRVEATAVEAVDARNNIFINERTGGPGGTRHSIFAADPSVLALGTDYNTYSTGTGPFASAGASTTYSILALWAIANGGSDAASDTDPVIFEGPADYRLAPSMAGAPSLAGVAIPGISTDLGGDARSHPYRGADEYLVTCTPGGPPAPSIRITPDGSLCGGGAVWGTYSSPFSGNGTVHRWQSRPLGSSAPFTDIVGADETALYLYVTDSTEFRMADSCIAGGPAVYSVPDTVIVNPLARVDSIPRALSGPTTVDFTAYPATGGLVWSWDFGDGTSATTSTPLITHTYGAEGVYTVRVIATNGCGSDTGAVQFVLGLEPPAGLTGVGQSAPLRVYPNPASGEFVVEGREAGSRLLLYDPTGRVLAQWTSTGRKTVCVFPPGLPIGVYALRVGDSTVRIVKE